MQINPQRPLRILIGTPAAGGMVSLSYLLSILDVFQNVMAIKKDVFIRDNLRIAKRDGMINEVQTQNLQNLEDRNLLDMDIGLYTLANESLLSRGRNHIAAVAIRQGWDKLFFIDADAKWNFQQFMAVCTAPYDLIAGVCPLKVLPISLNYLPFEDDEHYYRNNIRSMDSLLKMREGHGTPYIPIAFVGTAFMCLSRRTLLHCAEASEEYQYPNPQTGHLHTHWNMFDTRPMHGKFMSEDWSMCYRARSLGIPAMIHADVVISHVGSMIYAPELAQITHVPKQEGVFSSQIDDHPRTAVEQPLTMNEALTSVKKTIKENT